MGLGGRAQGPSPPATRFVVVVVIHIHIREGRGVI